MRTLDHPSQRPSPRARSRRSAGLAQPSGGQQERTREQRAGHRHQDAGRRRARGGRLQVWAGGLQAGVGRRRVGVGRRRGRVDAAAGCVPADGPVVRGARAAVVPGRTSPCAAAGGLRGSLLRRRGRRRARRTTAPAGLTLWTSIGEVPARDGHRRADGQGVLQVGVPAGGAAGVPSSSSEVSGSPPARRSRTPACRP